MFGLAETSNELTTARLSKNGSKLHHVYFETHFRSATHSGPFPLHLVLGVQMRCCAGGLLVGNFDVAIGVTTFVTLKANPQLGALFLLVVGKLPFLLWFDFDLHTPVMD